MFSARRTSKILRKRDHSVKPTMSVNFNNGLKCPIIGLGTYKADGNECYDAVKTAISVGYRHIDTALYYRNEEQIGEALSEKIADGTVRREDIFITSKLWNTFHRPDLVEPALKKTLKDLKTEYVDLYLIHWPTAFQDGWDLSPKGNDGKVIFSESNFLDTWESMESLVEKGLVKSIGLSNFNKRQIEQILSCSNIPPVNNQIEVHPYLSQKQLVEFCHSKNITVTAYRPLGGPPSEPTSPIHDPAIQSIAKKLGRDVGQVMIRYLIQRNIVAVPKSSNAARIESNLNVFDFELDEEDMLCLMKLDKGREGRLIKYEGAMDHKDYPFHDEF